MTGQTASEICDQLFGNSALEDLWLDLSNNDFSKYKPLIKSLERATNLVSLDISNSRLKGSCLPKLLLFTRSEKNVFVVA